jgi:hypothetical protein
MSNKIITYDPANADVQAPTPFGVSWGVTGPTAGQGATGDYHFNYGSATDSISKKSSSGWTALGGGGGGATGPTGQTGAASTVPGPTGATGAVSTSFGIVIDGGGLVLSTGMKGFVSMPYDATITGWDIFADQTGSVQIDVWKTSYAGFPPSVANTIAGSQKPLLSSAQKNTSSGVGTWTTAIAAGDVIAFNVDSASVVTKVTVVIKVSRT